MKAAAFAGPGRLERQERPEPARREPTVVGSHVGANTFPAAIRMLESGVVDPGPLVTHDLPLSEVEQGIEVARRGQATKVIVRPQPV